MKDEKSETESPIMYTLTSKGKCPPLFAKVVWPVRVPCDVVRPVDWPELVPRRVVDVPLPEAAQEAGERFFEKNAELLKKLADV